MTIQQLEYFEAVFKCRNMRKAAEDIFVSQPAISTVVRNLENELGVILFIRSNPLVPTDVGFRLHELAVDLIRQRDRIFQELQIYQEKEIPFKAGISTMAKQVLGISLDQELKENPDMESLTCYSSAHLQNDILEHHLELAVISTVSNFDHADIRFHQKKLISTPVSVYVSVTHPLAGLKTMDISWIRDLPLAAFSDTPLSGAEYLENLSYLTGKKLNNPIRLATTNLEEIRDAISGGTLCAIMLQGAFKEQKDIVSIPIENGQKADISVIWNIEHTLSCSESRWIKWLEDKSRKIE